MYINYSIEYLKASTHKYNFRTLEPFSPIFIPCSLDSENIILAPNPKLLKTMINNWGGAIARAYMQSNSNRSGDFVLQPEHIATGIQQARELSLFRSTIALFKKDISTGKIIWKGMLPRVCPAENVFTEGCVALLPQIYHSLLNIK